MARYATYLRMASDIVGQPARKWSNVFFMEAVSPLAAAFFTASAWAENLRTCCRERVYAYEVYATDLTPGTDAFSVVGISPGEQRGLLTTPIGEEPYMPKTCLAVTLGVSGGRPSRKFWRPGIYEGDIVNGVGVNPALVTLINTAFTNMIDSLGSVFVDPDGQNVFSVSRIRLTTREFGRESQTDVPLPPPLG